MSLSPETLERHKRHILLKEIGGPGVAKLRAAKVSLIGAGALGGPCALYLAAAGVGEVEIWDDDRVDRSNLQRQIQFGEADIGLPKAARLGAALTKQNPDTKAPIQPERFDGSQTLSGDILIDATDNYPARYALNATAHKTSRPMVHGAAARWTGQVSVFASGVQAGAPCYRCWVPEEPPEAEACDEVGVVGAITGMVGTRMALEAIKLITGAGTPLLGRIALLDGLSGDIRTLKLPNDPACPVCG